MNIFFHFLNYWHIPFRYLLCQWTRHMKSNFHFKRIPSKFSIRFLFLEGSNHKFGFESGASFTQKSSSSLSLDKEFNTMILVPSNGFVLHLKFSISDDKSFHNEGSLYVGLVQCLMSIFFSRKPAIHCYFSTSFIPFFLV